MLSCFGQREKRRDISRGRSLTDVYSALCTIYRHRYSHHLWNHTTLQLSSHYMQRLPRLCRSPSEFLSRRQKEGRIDRPRGSCIFNSLYQTQIQVHGDLAEQLLNPRTLPKSVHQKDEHHPDSSKRCRGSLTRQCDFCGTVHFRSNSLALQITSWQLRSFCYATLISPSRPVSASLRQAREVASKFHPRRRFGTATKRSQYDLALGDFVVTRREEREIDATGHLKCFREVRAV